MRRENISRKANLFTMARIGQWVTAISAALLVVYLAYLAITPSEALFLMQREVPGIVTLPSKPILALSAFVAALPALAFLCALTLTWKFFRLVGRGEHFSTPALTCLKWLGRAAIACSVLGVLSRTIMALLLSSANPEGQKMLMLGISSNDLGAAVVGVLVFFFANIVREATALAQENQSFI
jgi:hypothetical protein